MAKAKQTKLAATPKARKERSLRIRVTQEQKDTFEAAAERAGLSVSSWLVSLGLREAEARGQKN